MLFFPLFFLDGDFFLGNLVVAEILVLIPRDDCYDLCEKYVIYISVFVFQVRELSLMVWNHL